MGKKSAMVFAGQSSQYVGMGKKIYNEYNFVRNLFEEAEDILKMPIRSICFEEGKLDLNKTIHTQPAIHVVNIAFYNVFLHETGHIPFYAAGHSLGEYAALTCSGALDYVSSLSIIRKRAEYMNECGNKHPGEMWAISNCSIENLQSILARSGGTVSIGCYNNKTQNVLSGSAKEIHNVIEELREVGAYAKKLCVSGAFHSAFMSNASDKIFADLIQTNFNKMNFPVISNVTAKPYPNTNIPELLTRQCVYPVRWKATIDYLIDNGVTDIIELGPGEILKNMLKKSIHIDIRAYSYDNSNDRKSVLLQISEINSKHPEDSEIKDLTYFIEYLITLVNGIPCRLKKDVYERTVLPLIRELRALALEIQQQSQIEQYYDKAITLFDEILEKKGSSEQENGYRHEKMLYIAKELNLSKEKLTNETYKY